MTIMQFSALLKRRLPGVQTLLQLDLGGFLLRRPADGALPAAAALSGRGITGAGAAGCATEQDTEEETFGSLVVHELTVDELQSYDAGYCFVDPDAADDAPRASMIAAPRLATVGM